MLVDDIDVVVDLPCVDYDLVAGICARVALSEERLKAIGPGTIAAFLPEKGDEGRHGGAGRTGRCHGFSD